MSGFHIGDELVWGGLPYSDLDKMSSMIAATPWNTQRELIVYSNEAAGPIVRNQNCFKQPAVRRVPWPSSCHAEEEERVLKPVAGSEQSQRRAAQEGPGPGPGPGRACGTGEYARPFRTLVVPHAAGERNLQRASVGKPPAHAH